MSNPTITMYGTVWCGDCKRAKKFLGEQRIQYAYVDVEQDADGLAFVERVNAGKQIVPTIDFGDGTVLVEPSNAELASKLGLRTAAKREFYDLIVIGSGPAGLTAALYAAREGIDTLVIERAGIGGQAGITERLDNFPGFPEGISGSEFADRLRAQAERFGVEIVTAQDAAAIEQDGDYRVVRTADGSEYGCWAVLLAVGSTYRRLGIPGEEDFIGSGVHFCATCDGPFYRGRDVLVIGGGNSAGEESVFLTKFADHVTVAVRGEKMSASQIVRESVQNNPQIDVLTNTVVDELKGDDRLRSVVLRDTSSGARREIAPAGVFVFIGLTPNTGFVRDLVATDERGFIITDGTLQTSVPGIFAAGDCRAGSTNQAASAAGEGAAAALNIRRYLEPLASGMPRRSARDSEASGVATSKEASLVAV
jgi:thioredoxin reductase (NADPH)